MTDLIELDSLEILAIVDNELDPLSPCTNQHVQQSGGALEISSKHPVSAEDVRGSGVLQFGMDDVCCSAHGLSLLITGIKDGQKRTILFDTGPSESSWERNATRLGVDASTIEVIQLSHWHRDHSGGMLKVLKFIADTRSSGQSPVVDLHPDRPAFRGFQPPGRPVISLEADPTFEAIDKAGGTINKSREAHTVMDRMFLVSGEIPRVTVYEKGFKFGVRLDEGGKWVEDELMQDERLLMCKIKDKGIVVFTGCSHAGVVNTARHAMDLAKGSPLWAIVGGYHLAQSPPEVIAQTAKDLSDTGVKVLLAGHCTGWRAKFEMQKQMPQALVPCFVGSKYLL